MACNNCSCGRAKADAIAESIEKFEMSEACVCGRRTFCDCDKSIMYPFEDAISDS